jgi:NADP-dependent 3-hydroxy acid dehydrogenase YdfG
VKNQLKDKIVLITGAARGIGFADSKLFLQAGAKVAFCDILKEGIKEAKKKLQAFGEVYAEVADVRNEKQIRKFVNAVIKYYGKIDILVNNAGILPPRKNFADEKVSGIDSQVDINLKGVLHVTRAVIGNMVARKSGIIISMSSVSGLEGYGEMAVYCATKFGVRGFMEALAQEVEELGIKTYTICPGPVKTDMNSTFTGESAIGMPPEDVAKLILKIAQTLPQGKNCFEI